MAQEESRALGHSHIGTEHELLGLLHDPVSIAGQVLGSLGITAEHVREQVVRMVASADEATTGRIPFTPRAKKVMELSLREAMNLGHKHIGPEHLLLGLARENEGVATGILISCGADAKTIRDAVMPLLPGPDPQPAPAPQTRASRPDRGAWFTVTPAMPARRLLMAAGARALDDGRTEFGVSDLLLALISDEEAAGLLAELGVDEQAMRASIERHRAPRDPPEASPAP